jgi:hypothetical protein
MKKLLIIALSFFFVSSFKVAAKETGIWAKQKNFAQVNVACIQTYTCHPKDDVLHPDDVYVAVSKPELVTGVCSAACGPADSCNECLTNPPKTPCVWELRKIKKK